MTSSSPRIYLAGPDVFHPQALSLAEQKKAICSSYGLTGVFPCDNIPSLQTIPFEDIAPTIYQGNLSLMDSCDAILVNMTPFRGPSMDVGSAFEVGYFAAQRKPIFGYSNTTQSFAQRTVAHCSSVRQRNAVDLEDSNGMLVEDFGDMVDNLMMHESAQHIVRITTFSELMFTDLTAFEQSCAQLQRFFSSLS